jgi:hypothetical protein
VSCSVAAEGIREKCTFSQAVVAKYQWQNINDSNFDISKKNLHFFHFMEDINRSFPQNKQN